ncbi:MAG TPA: hypothetical protein VLF66_20760 [Thermoanaerobaculia bacterium]|nr:hypothetical protein [Thermoanaerobaculia bacterium]
MRRPELWLAAALTAGVLAPLWLVEHPPLQDYPYHLVRAQILAHHGDPAFDYREAFAVSWYPAPYVLADWLTAGLGRLVGVPLAGKLVLSLYLVLFPWSLIYLARGVGEERAVLGFPGFLLVYNWHYHMGFVSYALSLPAALFALGWWWRHRRELGAREAGVLALLALTTYLLHVYSFGVLGFVLVLLAPIEGWRTGRARGALLLAGRTLAALLPALVLLGGTVVRSAGRGDGGQGPLLLLYGNLKRKVLLALGSLPSFSLAWETALFAAAVATALALALLAWRRGARPEGTLLTAAGALGLLFMVLPDHVGRVFFVSNRVPLFLLVLALVALPVPAAAVPRRVALAVFAALAAAHLAVLVPRYLAIDRKLADYGAALQILPADARVAFLADREAMAEGRIAPAALFGGYHYLRAPASRMPDLEHFVGNLRTVSYRERAGRSLSTATVGSRGELAELLTRPWLVGLGGHLVVLGEDPGQRVGEAARAFGFRELGALGAVTLYRKTRPVFDTEPETPLYATGYERDFDYLVLYRDPARPPPEVDPSLEPWREWDWAVVYRSPGSG